MKYRCATCDSTGIGSGRRAAYGELMNLCPACDGHGDIEIDGDGTQRDFAAIFPVSSRYVVHLYAKREKGGHQLLDVQWSPRLPPKFGKAALTFTEKRDYERGRTAALAALMDQMGGGDWSVMAEAEKH